MIRLLLPFLCVVASGMPRASIVFFEDDVTLFVAGTPSADARRGIELGLTEMEQTAGLLGARLRLLDTAAGASASVVAEGGTPIPGRPSIHLVRGLSPGSGRCEFAIERELENNGTVLWHPSLFRYGASELNDRFLRRFDVPMTSEAWAGWAAVKALVESALRTAPGEDPCAALLRLRFDGHKGRPLSFDAQTRLLRHPTYIVRDGRVIGESRERK